MRICWTPWEKFNWFKFIEYISFVIDYLSRLVCLITKVLPTFGILAVFHQSLPLIRYGKIVSHFVGNEVVERILKQVFQENKAHQEISYPLIRTCTCAFFSWNIRFEIRTFALLPTECLTEFLTYNAKLKLRTRTFSCKFSYKFLLKFFAVTSYLEILCHLLSRYSKTVILHSILQSILHIFVFDMAI